MYDLLIATPKIVDGTGNPWFRDVAVSGAAIAGVGRVMGEAARVIETNGLCVCPGFIDVHAHGDFTPFDKTVVDYKLRQGITTEVNGNCGFSAAPVHPSTVGLVRQYVEGFIAPEQGVPWNWRSLGEYLDSITHARLAINIAPLIGHGALGRRPWVMSNVPSAAELDTMKALMRESMEQGRSASPPAWSTCRSMRRPMRSSTSPRSQRAMAASTPPTCATRGSGCSRPSMRRFKSAGMQKSLQISHHKASGKANHGKVRET